MVIKKGGQVHQVRQVIMRVLGVEGVQTILARSQLTHPVLLTVYVLVHVKLAISLSQRRKLDTKSRDTT